MLVVQLWHTRDGGELRTLNKARTLEAWPFFLRETRKTRAKSQEQSLAAQKRWRWKKAPIWNWSSKPTPPQSDGKFQYIPNQKSHRKIWFQKCDPLDPGQSKDKRFPGDIFHCREHEAPIAKTGNTSWRKTHNNFFKSRTTQGSNYQWGKVSR